MFDASSSSVVSDSESESPSDVPHAMSGSMKLESIGDTEVGTEVCDKVEAVTEVLESRGATPGS